jgi:hypothetical protein
MVVGMQPNMVMVGEAANGEEAASASRRSVQTSL